MEGSHGRTTLGMLNTHNDEELAGLLRQLSAKLGPHWRSEGAARELAEANRRAEAESRRLVKVRGLYDEVCQLLADQHSDDPPVRLGGALQTIDTVLSCAAVAQRVTEEGGGVFGLTPEVIKEAAGVTRRDMSDRESQIRAVVVPILAARLRAKCEAFASFCDSKPGLSFGRTSTLPNVIRKHKDDLQSLRREGQALLRERIEEAVRFEQVLVGTLDVLGRLVHEFKLKEQPRSDDLRRSELVAYTQAQVLKVARLRDELRRDTYDASTVPALTVIRHLLDTEHARALQERETLRERLRQYESLGPSFERIAGDYRAVQEQLREKRWALSQVSQG